MKDTNLETSMAENSTSVSIGDVFKINGRLLRVVDTRNMRIMTAEMGNCIVERFDMTLFMSCVSDGTYEKVEMPQTDIVPDMTDEEIKAMDFRQDVLEKVLEDHYPYWENLAHHRGPWHGLSEPAEEMGISLKQAKRMLRTYLMSGRNRYSLADQRRFKSEGSGASVVPRGPKFESGHKSSVLNGAELEKQYRYALSVFRDSLNVKFAWHRVLDKYYRVPVTDEDGTVRMKLLPEEDRISYKRTYHYISTHLGGMTITEYKKGERDKRNNNRPLSGNAQTGIGHIGQHYQLDECELDGLCVSESDPTKIIGKAVMYAAVDAKADIIVGVYVGLKNNSYSGFCDLMMSMLEDHNEQTKQVGVTCTPFSFPSLVMPKTIWADHGSEYESKALKKACAEMGIREKLVPVACGSFKGLVENVFMRIQHIMRPTMSRAGIIKDPTYQGVKAAKKEACLTLKDYRKIVYECVLDLNQALLDIHPNLEQMEAGIEMTPARIYELEKKKFSPVNVTDENRSLYLWALLGQDREFVFGRDGIGYKGHPLRYFTHDMWFIRLIESEKEWARAQIRYDDRCIDYVYVRYEKRLRRVPLSVDREEQASLKGLPWNLYDALYKEFKKKQDEAEDEALDRRLDTENEIIMTVEMAKALQGNPVEKPDKAEIRVARAVEKIILESGDTEARNRLLDGIDGGDKTDDIPAKAVAGAEESRIIPIDRKRSGADTKKTDKKTEPVSPEVNPESGVNRLLELANSR